MHSIPNPGDIIPLETGDALILETQNFYGNVRVLASRDNRMHPFAVWHWDNGALYSGRYFKTLSEAETHYWETT